MSYPVQPYNPNNGALINQQFNKPALDGNSGGGGNLFVSLFSLANRLMGEMIRNDVDIDGLASFMCSDLNDHCPKVFGVSSMNVTQIACGPDGRPHVIQAHNERRMGPGGIYQTKKALHDSQRGIEKMQVGYFVGNHGEIIERRLDPLTGQYRQEIQRQGIPPNESNFSHYWRRQSQQAIQQQQQQQPPLSSQQYQYYPKHQQLPFYTQPQQQALPAPSTYQYL